MKYIVKIALVIPALLFVGCGDLDKPLVEKVNGGEVVIDIDGVTFKSLLLQTKRITPAQTVYGYKAYKIPYTTTDEEGNIVNVSGLMTVPKGMPDVVQNVLGYSLVSDDHGTIFKDAHSPTVEAKTTSLPSGSSVILTAFAGFVTLQPDYIGFGDSNDHYHPFILKKSLANATIDFIKAGKIFASNNGIKLNGQLFLTGYSEGGYAAMATLQKIEADAEMNVTMAAPMAGPYAVEALATTVLQANTLSVPSFMANVGFAYAKAHNQTLFSVINAPYAAKLATLLNGSLDRSGIDPELTTVTTGDTGLFKTDFVTDVLTDDQNWFRVAARANDVHNWVPSTAVRLVHCLGDDVIPYTISQLAKGTMSAMSGGTANVALVPVEIAVTQDPTTQLRYGHAECGPIAYTVTSKMFAAERKAKVGY